MRTGFWRPIGAWAAAAAVTTTAPVLAVDPEVIESLRWRTSDSTATQRYLWILLSATAICVAIWLTYILVQRVTAQVRRNRRRRPRFPQRPVAQPAAPPWQAVGGVETSVKARAVIRLIQGADVDQVAEEIGVTTALLRDWVERFVRAGRDALDPASTWAPQGPRR